MSDLPGRQVQEEDVTLAPVAIRLERDLPSVGRNGGSGVVIRSERELLGLASLNGQPEQVTEQREDQRLAVRRDRYVGRGDLGGLDLDGAPAVGVLGEGGLGREERGEDEEPEWYARGRTS